MSENMSEYVPDRMLENMQEYSEYMSDRLSIYLEYIYIHMYMSKLTS